MPRTAQQVLEQEFLQTRAKILELAAFFYRLQDAENSKVNEEQLKLLKQGCKILTSDGTDKAAQVQLLFSKEYKADWRKDYAI
ncbi:MAG: hypothetical protein AAGG44_20185 [Planctomycetota bacterium]